VGARASKIRPVTSHRAYALKNIQIVPSAREKSSLTKDGACWPCCNGQQRFPNAEKVRPMSVVPPLHEAA
jgi:hypothetical protein